MNFSFIWPKITKKFEQAFIDTSIEEVKNILLLKEQLIAIGYNPGEVNYMIINFSNGIDIAKANSKQLRDIEKQLEEQLSIAKQCIDFVKVTE